MQSAAAAWLLLGGGTASTPSGKSVGQLSQLQPGSAAAASAAAAAALFPSPSSLTSAAAVNPYWRM